MVRGVLERVLSADALNALYDRSAVTQYTRSLLFSNVVGLMYLVVSRVQPSINAAYKDNADEIPVSITSVYNKLNGVDTQTSRALVRDIAAELGEAVHGLGGACTPWLEGYRVKVLDGNCIETTHHRLKPLRGLAAGALPGKSLVIYDPQLEMAIDVFPCEDGHAQERALLGEVLLRVQAKDLFVVDRNFCVREMLFGIDERQAAFICRQHQGLPWEAAGEECFVGQSETGALYEQWVWVTDQQTGQRHRWRRVRIVLKQATRDGDKELTLLTNLPKTAAPAKQIAWIYQKRWTIETAFQELEAHLHSEINALGYPKAALFGFCVALLAYNVLALVKAALRAEHGEQTVSTAVSGYYLAGHLMRTYHGMMIAIADDQWHVFQQMSDEQFLRILQQLAAKVNLAKFRKNKRGPKKSKPKPVYDPKHPHVSTAKLLDGATTP
jgi:IS4 transposase